MGFINWLHRLIEGRTEHHRSVTVIEDGVVVSRHESDEPFELEPMPTTADLPEGSAVEESVTYHVTFRCFGRTFTFGRKN